PLALRSLPTRRSSDLREKSPRTVSPSSPERVYGNHAGAGAPGPESCSFSSFLAIFGRLRPLRATRRWSLEKAALQPLTPPTGCSKVASGWRLRSHRRGRPEFQCGSALAEELPCSTVPAPTWKRAVSGLP